MFSATLSAPRREGRSLANGALLSAVAHVIVVAVVLRAPAHATPKKAEATEVTLRLAPPPPPPPLGGAQAIKATEPKKPVVPKKDTYVPRDPVKPTPAPDPAPAATAAGDPAGKVGGVIGGKEGGQVGGVDGGTGTALPEAPTPAPPPPSFTVLPFGEGMSRPQRVSGPEPEYTRQAREAKVEGTMLVKCVITTAGTLQRCRVIKSLPFLEQPVLEALARQRYTPVTFQGRAVDVEYVIPFKFKLQ